MFSPLEQFEVDIVSPCSFLGGIFNLTNMALFLLLSSVLIILIFGISLYNSDLDGNNYQNSAEGLSNFVLDIVKQQAGRSGFAFYPLFLWVFCFIAVNNFVGLFPFSFTTTAHIVVTLSLALSFNIGFLIYGFVLNGFKFLKLFVPSGAPAPLLPLIVVIEVVSYLIRSFSLALRLFANLMAGHTLLHILAGFVVVAASFSLVLSLVPYVLVFFVGVLEVGISILQAYVFTVLLAIYLNDSIHPGH